MKKIYLFYLLISVFGFAQGQTPFLDTVHSVTANSLVSFDTIDKGYVTAVAPAVDISTYQYARFDHDGNLLDTLLLSYPQGYSFNGCTRCLTVRPEAIYDAYTQFWRNDSGSVVLNKVSRDLSDTLKSKELFLDAVPPFFSTGTQIFELEFDSDSTFLLGGMTVVIDSNCNPLVGEYLAVIARFDTAFNLLWTKTIKPVTAPCDNSGYAASDIIIDSYGSFVVTGNAPWYVWEGKAYMARLRLSDGKLLWKKEFDNFPRGAWGMYAADNLDGTYRFVRNDIFDDNFGVNRITMGIIDTAGTVLKTNRFGNKHNNQDLSEFVHDFIRTKDGHYYAIGFSGWRGFHGFGFKFTEDLEPLWFKRYFHDTNSFTIGKTHWLERVIQEPDSSLMHVGYYIDNTVQSWLYRTDRFGCVVDSPCKRVHIGLPEQALSTAPWRVYPNPATQEFYIAALQPQNHQPFQYRVYDMQGRRMAGGRYPNRQNPIDISHLAPGLYLVVGRRKGKLLFREKLVVEGW